MNSARGGFALLAVLWVLVALAAIGAAARALAETDARASSNRALLVRAMWAREACVQLLLSDTGHATPRSLSRTSLGRRTWCEVRVEPAGHRLNVNLATETQLEEALGQRGRVDAILDWLDEDTIPRREGAERSWYMREGRNPPRDGAFRSIAELRLVRGFEVNNPEMMSLLTVQGDGRVSLGAPLQIVRALPGMTAAAAAALAAARARGNHPGTVAELLALMPPAEREEAARGLPELEAALQPPGEFLAEVEGGVDPYPLRARSMVVLRRDGANLAMVSRQEL